uniref:Rieske domain-containing protein n=1 Tax=Oryza brachyantha TaxID=4533 RepID=J3LTX2_ORYBR
MAPVSLHLLHRARPSLPFRDGGGRPASTTGLLPWRRQYWSYTSARMRLSMPVSAVAAETPPLPRADDDETSAPADEEEEKFDWLDQWYPVAPVCDLDRRAPNGKMVLGLRVVAWHDGGEWRVVDDVCPHRLAPLSEGRVDGKGRLQCAYHGWCFDGHGACQFIPQAPALGPPVHKNSRACVASYPSVVQNNILWFYPRSEPEHSDVLQRKRPPYFPELDDPSFKAVYGVRDLPYGYELLVENLMDPAHVPYAHRGLFPEDLEFDQERGGPFKMKIENASIHGFHSNLDEDWGYFKFVAPCTLVGSPFRIRPVDHQGEEKKQQPEVTLVFFCVPVAPGRSRYIWANGLYVGRWFNITPRWWYHSITNTVLDSDTYLLHIEERNFAKVGIENWHKACYVPTSSDNLIIAYRNWFRKYCNHEIGWATPTVNQLVPPTRTRVELLERYWSHVKQCTSCSSALKGMRALEAILQVASFTVIGFLAATKGTIVMAAVQMAAAVLLFAASRWITNFIEKTFYFQDYVHADK